MRRSSFAPLVRSSPKLSNLEAGEKKKDSFLAPEDKEEEESTRASSRRVFSSMRISITRELLCRKAESRSLEVDSCTLVDGGNAEEEKRIGSSNESYNTSSSCLPSFLSSLPLPFFRLVFSS